MLHRKCIKYVHIFYKSLLCNQLTHHVIFVPFALKETLKDINCSENSNLSLMVPTDMQADSELVLWALRLHMKFKSDLDRSTKDYYDIEEIAKQTEIEKLELMQEMEILEQRVNHLKCERPLEYIQWKGKVQSVCRDLKEKIYMGFTFMKREVPIKIFPTGGDW